MKENKYSEQVQLMKYKMWPRLQDVQGREANNAFLNGCIYYWYRVSTPTLLVH